MKKYIDKFWIFWTKLTSCFRFLCNSKNTEWVILFDEGADDFKEHKMTFQSEITGNSARVYAMLYTALVHTGGNVIKYLKEYKNSIAVDLVEKNMKCAKESQEAIKKMIDIANGDVNAVNDLFKK